MQVHTYFYLHTKAFSDGTRTIYVRVRWAKHAAAKLGDDPMVRLSTGHTCLPARWKKQRVQGVTGSPANTLIKALDALASTTLDNAAARGEHVAAAQLRQVLSDYIKYREQEPPAPEPEPEAEHEPAPTLAQAVAHWQKQMRGQRSDTYLRLMNPVVTYWEELHPGVRLEEMLPDAKTGRSELVEQWISFLLLDVPRRGSPGEFGLDNNTVGSYIKRLRTILQFAGLPYAWLKDELTYEIDIEPLEFEEVLQLAEAEMPRLQLERARDCFVFNCFTGPRYGNLAALRPSDVRVIKGQPILEYTQFKGRKKTKVKVALDPLAHEIWKRYNGELPVQSNTQMNDNIKEAARVAGLNRQISEVRNYGGKQQTRRGPIHEFITCHLARHTFATLLLDGDASIVEVQDGLGHSSLQSTRRYAKAREKQRHASTLGAFDKLRGK
jgi:integrase